MQEPEFFDERGSFIVKFYKEQVLDFPDINDEEENLLLFCKTPRTRKEICEFLGLSSITYAVQKYIMPLVDAGKIKLSIPENRRVQSNYTIVRK